MEGKKSVFVVYRHFFKIDASLLGQPQSTTLKAPPHEGSRPKATIADRSDLVGFGRIWSDLVGFGRIWLELFYFTKDLNNLFTSYRSDPRLMWKAAEVAFSGHARTRGGYSKPLGREV